MANFYLNTPSNLEVPIAITNRKDGLPIFFQVKLHPLVPKDQTSRIFVYQNYPAKEKTVEYVNWFKTRSMPCGSEACLDSEGMFSIRPVVRALIQAMQAN